MTSSTVLISIWYHGEERLNMMAKQCMAIELGGVTFLFVAGLLASLCCGLPLTNVFIGCVVCCVVITDALLVTNRKTHV
jgi:hypothetical protein